MAGWWLFLNLFSIVMLSFYSMMEMACVSFNKVRLQYYVSQNNTSAILLNRLLNSSWKLFGTTLIGVNVAMIFGSEFSRQFHSAIGLSPDLSPLSQVLLVVVFGELAPMFAARRYAEHVVMLGIKTLYLSSQLMLPFLWGIKHITRLTYKLFGGKEEALNIFLSQQELQKLIETAHPRPEELDTIVSNIFSLKQRNVSQVMTPLSMVPMIPSNCTIGNLRQILMNTEYPSLPVYHKNTHNIVGIAYPRDMIRETDNKKVREKARSPWFVPHNSNVMHLLKQFRHNKQHVAIVLDRKGQPIGMVTLETLVDDIFRSDDYPTKEIPKELVEKSFPGTTTIKAFNRMFQDQIPEEESLTLADVITERIGHTPVEGETVILLPYELTVKEASLLEVKTVTVRTHI